MQFTDKPASDYASKHAVRPSENGRLYEAVLHGRSLKNLPRKAIGDPLENSAFDYAARFDNLSIDERFRIHQAVIHGAGLPDIQTADEEYSDHSVMPFGKHKGKKLINIPAMYFIWLYDKNCDHPGIRKYIINNMDSLLKESGRKQKL